MYGEIMKESMTTKMKDNQIAESVQRWQDVQPAQTLQVLSIAGILDSHTAACLSPECNLTELTPDGWHQELEKAKPELVLVESAWAGKNSLWRGKINGCSEELQSLVTYCNSQKIPVVFWNNIDPERAELFLPAGRLADFVFITDVESIAKWKAELHHDRVYPLHFAAQTKMFHPIQKQDRVPLLAVTRSDLQLFRGSCTWLDEAEQQQKLVIYESSYTGRKDTEIALCMQSATQSQMYFSRSVFEQMASNTLVASNFCRGVKNFFGDLTINTDDPKVFDKTVRQCHNNTCYGEKLRLLSLRKVLSEHLYEDRLAAIVRTVLGRNMKRKLPRVCVFSCVANQEEADRILHMFRRQKYADRELLLICGRAISVPDTVRVISPQDWNNRNIQEHCTADFLACFSAKDWYGESYLLDMVLATRIANCDLIGKAEYYLNVSGKPLRCGRGKAYRAGELMAARRSMIRTKSLADRSDEVISENHLWKRESAVSIDAMNYCENWKVADCAEAADLYLPDQGISWEEIVRNSQYIPPADYQKENYVIGPSTIAKMMLGKDPLACVKMQGKQAILTSDLPEGVHRYFYLPDQMDISSVLDQNDCAEVLFRGSATMSVLCYYLFFDKDGQRLDAQFVKLGLRGKVRQPAGTAYMKVAYRVCGAGTAVLDAAEFGQKIISTPRGNCFLSRSNVLILTDNYPAPQDLYRNMFVHKRVTAYKEKGLLVDVMRMNPFAVDCVREFEGINVIEGHADTLDAILKNGSIDTVCVHFLNQDMWNVLKQYLRSVRLIVWSHGADIQPWWRRTFNYQTEEELEKAKRASESRMALWHEVFAASETTDIQFVFVSRFAANQVMEDYQTVLPEGKYHVIHNCIDTEQFAYVPKKPEDRKKLLSIRPYASRKYANDLMVNAILELSKDPWFPELEIALYGNGPLFDELLAPLQKFSNIHIEKKYFTQSEIAELHKQYGVFLTATREDTHGVSRDEAMSSGLVVVTNAVTAIPEFTDDSCAMLSPADDYLDMADKLRQLYRDPELYLKISENAAKRVRSQTSREYTIDKEIQLIWS